MILFQAKEKHAEIKDLIGPLDDTRFATAMALSKRITDYRADGNQITEVGDEGDIDENLGVAVVFDGPENSDEEDYKLFYWFNIAFCKIIFRKEDDLISHIRSCNKK